MPHGFKLPLQRGTDGASIVAMDLAQSMYCRRALCMRSCQQRCSWQVVSLRACERRCRHVSFCVHASHVAGACCLCVCQRWSCEAYHQHRRAGIGTGICIDCMHTMSCICERPSTKLVRISVSAPALSAGVHVSAGGVCTRASLECWQCSSLVATPECWRGVCTLASLECWQCSFRPSPHRSAGAGFGHLPHLSAGSVAFVRRHT
jgi:hypothetical protein